MHIGVTGPVSLGPLRCCLPSGASLPAIYSFPLTGKLAAELVRRGHEVTVFAGSYEVSEVVRVDGDRLCLRVFPMRRRGGPYDFYRPERSILADLIRESEVKMVHAHWTYEFAAGALDSGVSTLVTAHDSPLAILRYFVRGRAAAFWAMRSLLAARVVWRAKRLTAVSPYCREHVVKTLRPSAPCVVVPNGIESEWLEWGKQRLEVGEPNGPLTVVTVLEGFGGRKNSENALRAFRLVRERVPTARLRMFGTGHGPEEAGRWAKERGLADGVEFVGRIGQETIVRFLVEETHVLLHPSREESFGMALLEAMALGVPVVGGVGSGGVPYVVGDAGLLVDVNAPEAMAEALLNLAVSREQRTDLARKGWERAGAEFTLARMTDGYEREYDALLLGR
ncbi:MAG: hypothetical protein OHK005_16440 [Candidatus Methylacidiphilales bacterium]